MPCLWTISSLFVSPSERKLSFQVLTQKQAKRFSGSVSLALLMAGITALKAASLCVLDLQYIKR